MGNFQEFRFGLDLDNTLINYDESARVYARKNNRAAKDLNDLRNLMHELDSTGEAWKSAQAWIYTQGLKHASPQAGGLEFVGSLLNNGGKAFILSHKTEKTPVSSGELNLWEPAMEWLESKGFLSLFNPKDAVFFLPTQEAKVERIKQLELTHFIDDLLAIFKHSQYPRNVISFWLSNESSPMKWLKSVSSFQDLSNNVE